jgi:hypothetical protein
MPELLTKQPEAALQLLRSAGATCGEAVPAQTLKGCPPASLCKLPAGELCVYGLPDAMRMTQVSAAEWREVLVPGQSGATPPPSAMHPAVATASGVGLVLIGVAIGWILRRR